MILSKTSQAPTWASNMLCFYGLQCEFSGEICDPSSSDWHDCRRQLDMPCYLDYADLPSDPPWNRKSLILLDSRDINFLDTALRLQVALLVTCSPRLTTTFLVASIQCFKGDINSRTNKFIPSADG